MCTPRLMSSYIALYFTSSLLSLYFTIVFANSYNRGYTPCTLYYLCRSKYFLGYP